MKGLGIVMALVIISGFVAGQEVFGYVEPGTKEDKEFMSGIFLVGFVIIYGGVIYLRKSTQLEVLKKN